MTDEEARIEEVKKWVYVSVEKMHHVSRMINDLRAHPQKEHRAWYAWEADREKDYIRELSAYALQFCCAMSLAQKENIKIEL
ncbi:hypothetical protein HC928_00210 [bacterium]|nr:hypothetical protein [bacterium]